MCPVSAKGVRKLTRKPPANNKKPPLARKNNSLIDCKSTPALIKNPQTTNWGLEKSIGATAIRCQSWRPSETDETDFHPLPRNSPFRISIGKTGQYRFLRGENFSGQQVPFRGLVFREINWHSRLGKKNRSLIWFESSLGLAGLLRLYF